MKKQKILIIDSIFCICLISGSFLIGGKSPLAAENDFRLCFDNKNIMSVVFEDNLAYVSDRYSKIFFSNYEENANGLIKLNERGIAYNKTAINKINNINIVLNSFDKAVLYCGSYPFSREMKFDLVGENSISLSEYDFSFFTLQSESGETVIDSINVTYSCKHIYDSYNLPVVKIDTEIGTDGKAVGITSKTAYSAGKFNLIDEDCIDNNLLDIKGSFKIRGNSTAMMPKKSFRIKFDKKQSLFGLPKAKSWILMADYLDASKLHNFTAYTFADMVRENEYNPSIHHVRLILDGKDMGIYTVSEHPDEKTGRVDIEGSEYLTETDLSKLNWMVEFDNNVVSDTEEILDETYFTYKLQLLPTKYVALKYPEKENFYEIEDDETTFNSVRYYEFFNYVKEQIITMSESISHLGSQFETADNICDLNSLASYGLVDLFTLEGDHGDHSFKAYKRNGEKIKFGPVWDYDSVVFGLPYSGGPVYTPYTTGNISLSSTKLSFRENFSSFLFGKDFGKEMFANIWFDKSEYIENIGNIVIDEESKIIEEILEDSLIWYEGKDFAIFDNLLYLTEYLENRVSFLTDYFEDYYNQLIL